MPQRLVKLNQLIHLLLALFQSFSNYKEIFLPQWFSLVSLFRLSPSQHLPYLILGRENERTWESLPFPRIPGQVPACTLYSGYTELFVFNMPSLMLLAANPSASAAFLFAGYHFTELKQNSPYSPFSPLLLSAPTLAHSQHSQKPLQLLCGTFHAQIVYLHICLSHSTKWTPWQVLGKDHNLLIFISVAMGNNRWPVITVNWMSDCSHAGLCLCSQEVEIVTYSPLVSITSGTVLYTSHSL